MLPAGIEDLRRIRKECRRIASKRALLSAAGAVVPIPVTNIATDIVLLKQAIPLISGKFGLSREQIDAYDPDIAVVIYDVAKKLGPPLIGQYVTKRLIMGVLKKFGVRMTTQQIAGFVPLVGQAISVGISFTAMKLILNAHINSCYAVAKGLVAGKSGGETIT